MGPAALPRVSLSFSSSYLQAGDLFTAAGPAFNAVPFDLAKVVERK